MRTITRVYPIRTTKNKWKIPLYSYHICEEECSPNCQKKSDIKKTLVNILSYNESEINNLYNPDDIVIAEETFSISIRFPLTSYLTANINTKNPEGFTLHELITSIKTLYTYIYIEEEETARITNYEIFKICEKCRDFDFKDYVTHVKTTNEECCICCEKYEDNAYELKCGHPFHIDCIQHWMYTSMACPLCRKIIYNCDDCGGSGTISYIYTGTVIPVEERGIRSSRNRTYGVFGIYGYDLEDLYIKSLLYDRVKNRLYLDIVSV